MVLRVEAMVRLRDGFGLEGCHQHLLPSFPLFTFHHFPILSSCSHGCLPWSSLLSLGSAPHCSLFTYTSFHPSGPHGNCHLFQEDLAKPYLNSIPSLPHCYPCFSLTAELHEVETEAFCHAFPQLPAKCLAQNGIW